MSALHRAFIFVLATLVAAVSALAAPIRYQPRAVILGSQLVAWDFRSGGAEWGQPSGCTTSVKNGVLILHSTSEDPSIKLPVFEARGPLVIQIRARCATAGSGEIFWTTQGQPAWNAKQSKSFPLRHDGEWHEYQVLIEANETISQLRFDPGSGPGMVEVAWIRLLQGRPHPLEVQGVRQSEDELVIQLANHDTGVVRAHINEIETQFNPGESRQIRIPLKKASPFEIVPVAVRSPGLPEITFTVSVYDPGVDVQWLRCSENGLAMDIAPDGSGVRLWFENKPVGTISPLVRAGDVIPAMKLVSKSEADAHFRGEGIDVRLQIAEGRLRIQIIGTTLVEGPVVRVQGRLKQGLLAGVEYLGADERSSSTLDIETDDHWRVRPDPLSITMPLMAFVTDQICAALVWDDPVLQPIFATPNFLDGTDDHRMGLEGRSITATLLLTQNKTLEDLIVWAVAQKGLPALPTPPRDEVAQRQLDVTAMTHTIAGPGGWGHAAEARWERRPYADVASAIGRLTGTWPTLGTIESGGAHIRNDAVYLVGGQGEQWLRQRTSEARSLLAEQKADGSFRYDGPYRRGHHENTASGYNAWRATILLEFARLTGDGDALQGGLRCLEFMKRFQTPRGAQTHELPLHTPDLLGSAYLVWSYTLGYELTGNPDYLAAARKWAISGLPFVYQWGQFPTMAYATIPAFGATQWVEPNWIGLPVQWCGGVYGYALTMLHSYDTTLNWEHIARGILIAGEQMQYPNGPLAGCVPDFFLLREQRRAGPSINPGFLISLRLALEHKPGSLVVAASKAHRLVSPFPAVIEGEIAFINAPAGLKYQVLIDGKRFVTLTSTGRDQVQLTAQ